MRIDWAATGAMLSGEGTLLESGKWSTSSVMKYFSVVYSAIFAP